MKDVSKQMLENLISFIYCGKVNVQQDSLVDFFKTAKAFNIIGLADSDYSNFMPVYDQQKETFAELNDDLFHEQSTHHTAYYKPAGRLSVQYQSCQTNEAQFFTNNTTLIDCPSHSPSLADVKMNYHELKNESKDDNKSAEQENALRENDAFFGIDDSGREPSGMSHDVLTDQTFAPIVEPFNNVYDDNNQSRKRMANDSIVCTPVAKQAKYFKGNL